MNKLSHIFEVAFKLAPFLMIVTVILVYLFLIFCGFNQIIDKASIVLIPLVISSVFLILTRDFKLDMFSIVNNNNNLWAINKKILSKIYFILFFVSIIIIANGFYESVINLILNTLMYIIIIIQILSKDKTSIITLLYEIILTSTILMLPLLASSNYYISGSDIIYHLNLVEYISSTGTLFPQSLGPDYYYNQGYHIYIAISNIIINLNSNITLGIVFTIPFIISSLFVYSLSKYFTNSYIISLLSTIIYLLSYTVLRCLTLLYPFAWSNIFYIILIYLIICINSKRYRYYVILILIIAYVATIHYLQPLVFIIFLFILIIVSTVWCVIRGNKLKLFNNNMIIISIICLISYMIIMYISKIVRSVDKYFFEGIRKLTDAGLTTTDITNMQTGLYYILGELQTSIMVFLVFIATIIILTKVKSSKRLYFLGLVVIISFILYTNGVVESVSSLSIINMGRWRMFFAPFFSIIMTLGILWFSTFIQNITKTKNMRNILIIVIIIMLTFGVYINFINGNDLFKETDELKPNIVDPSATMNAHFSNQLLIAVDTIMLYFPEYVSISSDASLKRYLMYKIKDEKITIRNNLLYYYYGYKKMGNRLEYIIQSKELLYNRGFNPSSTHPVTTSNKPEIVNIFKKYTYLGNIIYTNGDVEMYI